MSIEEYALETDNFLTRLLDAKDVVATIIARGDKIVDVRLEFPWNTFTMGKNKKRSSHTKKRSAVLSWDSVLRATRNTSFP